jgi:hypothetical protein
MKKTNLLLAVILTISINPATAEDSVELQTTFIKGNKELPQILYIVPWKSIEKINPKQEKLVLHSLFGDIFDPVTKKDLAQ